MMFFCFGTLLCCFIFDFLNYCFVFYAAYMVNSKKTIKRARRKQTSPATTSHNKDTNGSKEAVLQFLNYLPIVFTINTVILCILSNVSWIFLVLTSIINKLIRKTITAPVIISGPFGENTRTIRWPFVLKMQSKMGLIVLLVDLIDQTFIAKVQIAFKRFVFDRGWHLLSLLLVRSPPSVCYIVSSLLFVVFGENM